MSFHTRFARADFRHPPSADDEISSAGSSAVFVAEGGRTSLRVLKANESFGMTYGDDNCS